VSTAELTPEQSAAWQAAQRLWGVRMHPPTVLPDAGRPSFSWFGFPPAITFDPALLAREGGAGHLVSVFAHELGHHVLAPSTRLDGLKIDYQMARTIAASDPGHVLDVREEAAHLANLWEDLVINERVVRAQRAAAPSAEADLIALWRALSAPLLAQGPQGAEADPAWWVYLRAYERLWRLPAGTLCDPHEPHLFREAARRVAAEAEGQIRAAGAKVGNLDQEGARADLAQQLFAEADAVLLADTVRRFGADPVAGAAPCGMILAPYLVVSRRLREQRQQAGQGAGGGNVACAADPGAAPTAGELARVLADARLRERLIHPVDALAGEQAESATDGPDEGTGATATARSSGQSFGIAETLELFAGADPDAVMAAWYEAEARPWVSLLQRRGEASVAPELPGPLELWETGEDLADIDWPATLAGGTVVVPGVTTVRRTFLADEPSRAEVPVALDLYIDSSGSMMSPQQGSPAVLAGMILALSVLRGGGRVRTTSFSSAGQVAGTADFSRERVEIVKGLTTYFGGGTTFPLDLLAQRYLDSRPRRGEERHLVVLTDTGYVSLLGHGQEQFADVAARVRAHVVDATMVIDGRVSDEERTDAAAGGYELIEVAGMEGAPAVCARLAAKIAGRSTR
jgi:hypothetical protein